MNTRTLTPSHPINAGALAASTKKRQQTPVRHLLWSIALVVGFAAAPESVQAQTLNTVQKGHCPSGFQPTLNNSPPYAYCRRVTNQTVRQYTSYTPCVPPGQYRTDDESTGGLLPRGHDRCSVVGAASGPALPCPPTHAQREIRQNQVDRCYRNNTQQVTEYANMTLSQ